MSLTVVRVRLTLLTVGISCSSCCAPSPWMARTWRTVSVDRRLPAVITVNRPYQYGITTSPATGVECTRVNALVGTDPARCDAVLTPLADRCGVAAPVVDKAPGSKTITAEKGAGHDQEQPHSPGGRIGARRRRGGVAADD